MGPNKLTLVYVVALLCTACDACGNHDSEGGVAEGSSEQSKPTPAAKGGTVRGVVRLAPGQTLPAYPQQDLERAVLQHTKRGKWPDSCTPPKDADSQPVKLTPEGFLSGVMVAASEFEGAKPRPPRAFEVVIRDCRLEPTLVVAMKGDSLVIKNEVDFPFMPTFGRTQVARTLMPGQQFDFPLDRGGLQPVLCGFTAPCGRTDVITVYHPVFGVTGADGRFSIEDFPTDQTVKLNAWHPLFAETHIEIVVGQGEDKEVELILSPVSQGDSAAGDTGDSTAQPTGASAKPAPTADAP